MKATGIVRRIDDLGRIVIPKEIRRTLRIREGDIAGGVIFLQKNEKKHFGEMEKKFAAGAADLLGRQLS